jgi:hypothetical protein
MTKIAQSNGGPYAVTGAPGGLETATTWFETGTSNQRKHLY